jgi:hypothetical protein
VANRYYPLGHAIERLQRRADAVLISRLWIVVRQVGGQRVVATRLQVLH